MGSVTLEQIRDVGSGESYPTKVLEGCESALVLFAAAFLGKQDAFWIAEAGLQADCVDIDEARLAQMADLYPGDWFFTVMDVFEFAEAAKEAGQQWDVVSIDCPTGLFSKCAEEVGLWCGLARHAVILGHGGASSRAPLPRGWRLTDWRKRSSFMGGVYWAVLEKK